VNTSTQGKDWLVAGFHDFEMSSIDGEQVSFDTFRDSAALVVNVASQ